MKRLVLSALSLAALALAPLQASVIEYSSESMFQSQGTIAYNSTFNDFGTGFGFPGDPFTRGDVTYTSTNNLTWGNTAIGWSGLYSTLSDTLIGNNWWTPITGTISTGPQYNMFGFHIGTYNTSPITFNLTTNLGNYTFASETIADSAAGNYDFRGFISGSGEYLTGFSVVADYGSGNLPGLTHVQVGHTANNVPDGSTTLLLSSIGFLGLAALRRFQR
jgi:hypothetical protein